MDASIVPACADTQTLSRQTWRATSLASLLIECRALEVSANQGETGRTVLYRGQSSSQWPINSTFARNASGHFDVHDQWYGNRLHQAYIDKFRFVIRPSPELLTAEAKLGVDAYFELMKRMQQHPEEFSGRKCIEGTNLVDWTMDREVALAFASEHPDREGVLYVLDAVEAGEILMIRPVSDILDIMERQLANGEIHGAPILFCPNRQINYIRADRQKARYIAQTDLRHSLDEVWRTTERVRGRGRIFHRILIPPNVKAQICDEAIKTGRTRSWLLGN